MNRPNSMRVTPPDLDPDRAPNPTPARIGGTVRGSAICVNSVPKYQRRGAEHFRCAYVKVPSTHRGAGGTEAPNSGIRGDTWKDVRGTCRLWPSEPPACWS